MHTASPAGCFLMTMSLQGLLTHLKTLEVQQVKITGGIYCSDIEAMKAPHIMRRRVSYMSKGETGGQYRVAHECINTKVPTKSDVLVILLLPKLAACAMQRQLRVFIDRLQESFLLARLRI